MIMIFINGIENAEQRTRQSDSVLPNEDFDDRTKAWLLMVESGKVDEEQLRKITPKSVFIAPLLSSRSGKCKEGYRHDHLGNCVKVIQIDPNAQLQALLAKLNAMYAEKKVEEEEEERLPEISNEPLHFSLPISEVDTTPKEDVKELNVTSVEDTPEVIPVPLPMVSYNETENNTYEASGFGALNNTDVFEGSGFGNSDNGSGFGSGSAPIEDTTQIIDFMSDEFDYTDSTEMSTTEIPTESYQSVTNVPDDSNFTKKNETSVKSSNTIRFPNDDIERTRVDESIPQEYIRFPDEQPPSVQQTPNWNSNYPISAIPREQFWWLPENWKVDERQHKPTLVKFWSRLPLIHDNSYVKDSVEEFRKTFVASQPHTDIFRPSSRIGGENFQNRQPGIYRRGRFYGS